MQSNNCIKCTISNIFRRMMPFASCSLYKKIIFMILLLLTCIFLAATAGSFTIIRSGMFCSFVLSSPGFLKDNICVVLLFFTLIKPVSHAQVRVKFWVLLLKIKLNKWKISRLFFKVYLLCKVWKAPQLWKRGDYISGLNINKT